MWGKKLKDPVRGTARVVSSSQGFKNSVYVPLHAMLIVEAPGIPPTSVEYRQRVARRSKLPFTGQVIPVYIDRADPTRVRIVWDEMPTQRETLRQQGQTLAAAMHGENDPPGDVAGVVDQIRQAFPDASVNVAGASVDRPAQTGQDPIGQLERLARLRDSGVLTPEEFAQEKARILGRE